MKKITVVLPLHNSKKYIKECMDSIVHQTLQDIEIICIDSGADETSDIIHLYALNDNRIKYVYDDNSSYGYKINKGISLSQGKYIAIIESDDYAREDMMQILYEIAEENNIDFVKADYMMVFDINGKRVEEGVEHVLNKRLYNRVIDLKKEPMIKDYIGYSIWAGLYRKEFLTSNGLFLNETMGASYQDTGFATLVALMAKRVYFTDHHLYRYRIDNNDSSVKSQIKYRCIIEEFRWIKEQMQLKGLNKVGDASFYKNKKLISYFWNYQRLLPEYKMKFLDEIKEEMENEFLIESSYGKIALPERSTEIKVLLGDVESMAKFEQSKLAEQQYFQQIVMILKSEKEVVVFGAGLYGELVLILQDILDTGNVVAICDNDKQKYNVEIAGLSVGDPQKTVLKHEKAFYVIANKKNGEEILQQLKEYGILQKNIYVIKGLPGKAALLEAALRLSVNREKGV